MTQGAALGGGPLTRRGADSNEWTLSFSELTSHGMVGGGNCGAGVLAGSPLEVEGLVLLDAATGYPLPSFSAWVPNEVTGQEFSEHSGEEMAGFLAGVPESIPDDVDLIAKVSVRVDDGTTFEEVKAILEAAGAVFGGDAANPDGSLTGDHLALAPVGEVVDACDPADAPSEDLGAGLRAELLSAIAAPSGSAGLWPGPNGPMAPAGENALSPTGTENLCCRWDDPACSDFAGTFFGGNSAVLNSYWTEVLPDPIPDEWTVYFTSGVRPPGGSVIPLSVHDEVVFDLTGFSPGDEVAFCIATSISLPNLGSGICGVVHGFSAETPGGTLPVSLVSSFSLLPLP